MYEFILEAMSLVRNEIGENDGRGNASERMTK